MIKVNTRSVDPPSDVRVEAGESDFDTSSFEIPNKSLNPDGTSGRTLKTRLIKAFDWVVSGAASIAFDGVQLVNRFRPNPSFTPKWSEKPLLKSWEKSKRSSARPTRCARSA